MIIPYLPFTTAGSDYEAGPYTVTFTAGQTNAILTVSTMDDNTTELSEYFNVMITSVDRPNGVNIGAPSTSVITIVDDEEGNVQPCVMCIA